LSVLIVNLSVLQLYIVVSFHEVHWVHSVLPFWPFAPLGTLILKVAVVIFVIDNHENVECGQFIVLVLFFIARNPQWTSQGRLVIEASRSHSDIPQSVALLWTSDQPDAKTSISRKHTHTQHSQQTDIHASDGIRARNLSRRMAVDPHLRPRGHWDLLC